MVVVWFIRRTIADAWSQLHERPWHCDFRWLLLSGLLYLAGTLMCGLFWHRALCILGQPVRLGDALRAYFVGHLGKYVPGKAMVVVLRTGLVHGDGVDTSLAAVSVFFETLTMMAVGALMSAAIMAVWFRHHGLLFGVALATVVAAGLPTLPPVFRRLVRLVGVGRATPTVAEKLSRLDYRTMFLGWLLTGFGWVLLGASFWAVLRALGAAGPNPFVQLPLHTAAVALGTVAGFVSLVPGGAVVREAVVTELTAPYLGDAAALVGAVLLRLVWLVAELGISGILYCGVRRRSR